MFDLIGFSLLTKLLGAGEQQQPPLNSVQMLAWEELALFSLPHAPEPIIEKTMQNYLQNLSHLGISGESQGVCLTSEWWTFASHREEIPQSAASLTKIATSLAALETWGGDHQFETVVKRTGEVKNGVLAGDLVIEGGGDPFFVWEEAIALGNRLNELGIEQVRGNLIVVGAFYMNYQDNPQRSSQLLAQGLNAQLWSNEAQKQYQTLPTNTPRPQVQILGDLITQNDPIPSAITLIRHQSLPLTNILQQMNIYSNNKMADLIAQSVGGSDEVEEIVVNLTQVSPEEVQLINGSGLGIDNRLSPRAVCKMLAVIHQNLEAEGKTIADIFPVTGIEMGTVRDRALPKGIAVKTGTLWNVSALAGAISTDTHGLVYFTIINQNGNVQTFRNQQDKFLQSLGQQWKFLPLETQSSVYLGDPQRNQ